MKPKDPRIRNMFTSLEMSENAKQVLCNCVAPFAAALTVLFAAYCGTVYAESGADPLAAAASTAQPSAAPATEELTAGVWQAGKASFSDWKLFDLFLKPRYARGYKPKQPIAYSHRTHVLLNKMECQYCHAGAARSRYATLPSVESCIGCHLLIKPDLPEVQKLKEYWDARKTIEWIPVSSIPEHVKFNHKRHLKAGVACHLCHGQIPKMEVVERVSSFKMGFCISCHRQRGASTDCAICHY